MKKLFLLVALVSLTTISTSQDLENIINRHTKAINAEKLSEFSSVIIKGSISQQGMQMDLVMYEKHPDKIKIVSGLDEMKIVQVINGDRGYMINPLMGSDRPIPLSASQVNSMKTNSMIQGSLINQYEAGMMEIAGEEFSDGRATYKIKVNDGSGQRYIFIDKESFLLTRISISGDQMGMDGTVNMKMSDFEETGGVIVARTIETFINGQPGGRIRYESIEFNRAIDDSEFIIK